jgi:hypothetical protein
MTCQAVVPGSDKLQTDGLVLLLLNGAAIVHTLSEGHVPVDVSGFGNQELDEPKHCLPADMHHEERAMNSERCNVIGRMPSHGMQMRNEGKHAI